MRSGARATEALGWATLFVVGSAAALSLVVAGPSIGYQHYVPLAELVAHPVATTILAAQAVAVVLAMFARRRVVLASLRALLPRWRLPVLMMGMVASSAVVNRDLTRFGGELLLSTAVQAVGISTVWLCVRAIPAGASAALERLFERGLGDDVPFGADIAPRLDRVAYTCAAFALLASALLSVTVYERHPHLMDEVAYLFQARTFASGNIALPNPPAATSFEVYLVDWGSRGWYSPVPPGWAALMAPAVWVGATWLVNPVLTGCNALLASLVLHTLYGQRVARLATVLFVLSPWNLFLGMSFMPHAVTLTCALLATLGVMAARRTDLARWGWLAGLALGAIASVRQLDAMIMAAALGLWSIGIGGRRLRVSAIIGLVLGALVATIPLLAFNRAFTGSPGTFPMMQYVDARFGAGANDYGFGANRGMGWGLDPNPGHGPLDGAINSALNLAATQVELFGWTTGSLLLVFVFVLRSRLSGADHLMLGLIGLTWLAYFFNYFSGGPDFGARYWFLMIVPLVSLSARGALMGTLPARRESAPDVPRVAGRHRPRHAPLLSALSVVSFAAIVLFMPWRSLDKYWHYRGMRPDLREIGQAHRFGRGLILVAGREVPDYASAFAFNSLDLRAPTPVFASRRDPESDSAVILAFQDRPVWFVDGPTVSASGSYAVRAGPLSTSDALAHLSVLPAERVIDRRSSP